MNERLTELYRACRSKEALASQDQFKSANVLIGSELEKFIELFAKEIFSEMKHQLFLHSEMQATDPGYSKAMTNTLTKFGVEE